MLLSCSIREANTHLVIVKDGVVCSHEDITHYPERAYWRGNVQIRESANTLSHESIANLENVLFWLELKYPSAYAERDTLQGINVSTVHI